MNEKLLLQVKRHILEDPRRAMMDAYIVTATGAVVLFPQEILVHEKPPCGAVGCLLGWGNIFNEANARGCEVEDVLDDREFMAAAETVSKARAIDLLGVPVWQADNLQFLYNWPLHLWWRYRVAALAGDRTGIAQAMADRIDLFILSKGTDNRLAVLEAKEQLPAFGPSWDTGRNTREVCEDTVFSAKTRWRIMTTDVPTGPEAFVTSVGMRSVKGLIRDWLAGEVHTVPEQAG